MITWPHFAEQFLNGETNCRSSKNWSNCGGESPTIWGVETSDVLVKKDDEIYEEFV